MTAILRRASCDTSAAMRDVFAGIAQWYINILVTVSCFPSPISTVLIVIWATWFNILVLYLSARILYFPSLYLSHSLLRMISNNKAKQT